MLGGFNEGWIEFENTEAGSRKGKVALEAVLQTLIDLDETRDRPPRNALVQGLPPFVFSSTSYPELRNFWDARGLKCRAESKPKRRDQPSSPSPDQGADRQRNHGECHYRRDCERLRRAIYYRYGKCIKIDHQPGVLPLVGSG